MRRALRSRHRWMLVVAVALSGCSVVMPQTPRKPLASVAARVGINPKTYRDYAGVMHVHTTYSHDAHGTLEDVVRAANAQRLDFVVLTEHNTLQPLRDGKAGWHGNTLVLVGMELSTRGGHYLALNVSEEFDYQKMTAQQVINEVKRQGGLGFIAHPFFKKRPWTDWTVSGMTGIEAYNVAHDALDENKLRLAVWTLTATPTAFYMSLVDRPYDPLRVWDSLIEHQGRVVGIGSTDAHEFHAVGMTFAPYSIMFQLIRTHVLVPDPVLTPQGVYDALRQGHAYLSVELMAPASGFHFSAARGGAVVAIMGDEIPDEPGLTLVAELPAPAQMALMQDGRQIDSMVGLRWEIPVSGPGVYRLEVSRHNKPWIYSNPIYIRPMMAQPAG